MHLLITGASGFLGRYTVARALQQGYRVRAISRRKPLPQVTHPNLTWVQADLSQPPAQLSPLLQDIDGVIHLAAAMTGDFATQQAGTVTATENILTAMERTGVKRLIAISSFSVYDYKAIPAGGMLDEAAPLETIPEQRDIYTQMKLQQEQLVRGFDRRGGQVTILRPGMIYGPDHLLNAFLGSRVSGPVWLRVGQQAQLPLSYVAHCADAIISTVDCSAAVGQTFNIVDDDLPTQATYAALVATQLATPLISIVMPWPWMQALASLAWHVNQRIGGSLKLPGLLVPARLHARCKPLQYTNAKAKQILGWQPTHSLVAAVSLSDASCSQPQPLQAI